MLYCSVIVNALLIAIIIAFPFKNARYFVLNNLNIATKNILKYTARNPLKIQESPYLRLCTRRIDKG